MDQIMYDIWHSCGICGNGYTFTMIYCRRGKMLSFMIYNYLTFSGILILKYLELNVQSFSHTAKPWLMIDIHIAISRNIIYYLSECLELPLFSRPILFITGIAKIILTDLIWWRSNNKHKKTELHPSKARGWLLGDSMEYRFILLAQ